jgi:hypothetical protein
MDGWALQQHKEAVTQDHTIVQLTADVVRDVTELSRLYEVPGAASRNLCAQAPCSLDYATFFSPFVSPLDAFIICLFLCMIFCS